MLGHFNGTGEVNSVDDYLHNTFLVGIDLEAYAGVNEDKLLSGLYTYGVDVFLEQKFGQELSTSKIMFSVCLYDAHIIIEGG